ncbi:MAG: type II secretion system F family protein [Methylococcales bacterium]
MLLSHYVYVASSFVLFGLTLLVLSLAGKGSGRSTQVRFQNLLEKGMGQGVARKRRLLEAMERKAAESMFLRWMTTSDEQETAPQIRQAGWNFGIQKTLFYLFAWLSPLIAVAGVGVYLFYAKIVGMQAAAWFFIAFTIGFILPRYVLRHYAAARRKAIAREVPTMIHMLRMLFDAGLSTEHAIYVLHSETEALMPNLSQELKGVLKRINTGHDRADALIEMAAPLDVPDLTDTAAILKQVTQHGGNVRDSLLAFARLIDERQQSALREYVSKLSAKMTVVMMLFLFPALLIFLAGPGFLALAKALLNVSG